MSVGGSLRRGLVAVAGAVLLAVGVVLLVLPGPGLLLVLAGLLVLASEFPTVGRYVEPVRTRAMQAAAVSVSSPLRLAGSATVGLLLVAAGIVWGLVEWLPLSGWSTGSSLMLSGAVVLALLVWSYQRERSPSGPSRRPRRGPR
ncbi:MAG TPA: PGPGW domain-containing protein [Pseudonocardiaceae bacterium]|nr:PGPGW domain-containing protein [Pseudonocardiaceae bacterium]